MPRISLKRAAVVLLVAACTSACGAEGAGPDFDLEDEESDFIALEQSALLTFLIDGFVATLGEPDPASKGPLTAALEPIVTEFEFVRTAPCRRGGRVVATGTMTRTRDRETRTRETAFSGEKSIEDCVRGRGDITITTRGQGTFEGFRKWVGAAPSGVQWTEQRGAVAVATSDGRRGECAYDLRRELDPDLAVIRVTGTFCGRRIEREITWGP